MNFNDMDIDEGIKLALTDMGFEMPTPIQHEVIPLILDNKDVIAQAPTGTGKTCAFGIPVINKIDVTAEGIGALILCPTRELVIQTENELKEVAKYKKDIRIISIYGGQNIDRQLAGLRKKPQIVIGTTGRVMDHLRRKTLKLAELKILVLDEVDEMLNMGFREDIDVILKAVPKEKQTVLFSATMPKEIVEISRSYQTNPISIKTQFQQSDIPKINQYYVPVSESEKISTLISIIKEKGYGLALVFCNTKKRVDELNLHLNTLGIEADALHGDLRQHTRDKTMKKFRGGQIGVLIATDVAARGIDVDNIGAVFNFDIPHDEEYYVHRIGRTARANEVGDAYTFVSEKQMYAIKNFERYTKNPIIKAEFIGGVMENNIDKKLFEKTLKLIKRGELTSYKEFIKEELIVFQDKYEQTEVLDIAAALLMQLNEEHLHKNTVLSEPVRSTNRERPANKERTAPRGRRNEGVRFFMNIGSRDNCDNEAIKKYIVTRAGVAIEDILDVNCLESFSFASVKEGNNELMEALNGLKYNKRILAVEVADSSKKKTDGGGFKSRPDNGFRGKPEGGFRGKSEGGFRGKTEGGFRGKTDSAFKGKTEGGYKGKSEGGFRGKTDSEFKGKTEGGYKGKSEGGFRGKTDSSDKPKFDQGKRKPEYNKTSGNRDNHSSNFSNAKKRVESKKK